MERALLYVSRRSIATIDPNNALAEILEQARGRNFAKGITGALICTQVYFAQLLEGPGVLLDELMHRIELDHRHSDVTILRVNAIARRELPSWSMAYSGPSSYVARQIEPLIGETTGANPARTDRLLGLLVGLASVEAP